MDAENVVSRILRERLGNPADGAQSKVGSESISATLTCVLQVEIELFVMSLEVLLSGLVMIMQMFLQPRLFDVRKSEFDPFANSSQLRSVKEIFVKLFIIRNVQTKKCRALGEMFIVTCARLVNSITCMIH